MEEPSDRPARILVVEDDRDMAQGLRENLVQEGYSVRLAGDGQEALDIVARDGFDLIILDVLLPELDGFAACRRLRERGEDTPVLFLTAKDDPEDRIRGLSEGGDDYIAKPFQLTELLLRVSAILRRRLWYREAASEAATLEFGDNRVDFRTYRAITWDGTEQDLTHKEAMILKLLAEREGEVVSREDVLDRVWGYDAFPTARTIDNFILRLRRRFERDSKSPRHFHTIRGVGYRFEK